ncbi:unnamed protein product [Danaus chrysippus]|uniref:(African queen) hypothetical protein n=1 Tax=Danaus chrysippus TaxID=151541 RepID=A0A8J2REI5_9NEOP|nr:unnamed protein product [Danaus chrysippus]
MDDNDNYWTGFYCIACREEKDLNPDHSIPYNETNNERPKGTVIDLLSEVRATSFVANRPTEKSRREERRWDEPARAPPERIYSQGHASAAPVRRQHSHAVYGHCVTNTAYRDTYSAH